MNCLYCRYYDKNDALHAYGTCEPQDEDFHCTHECNLTDDQIKELELLDMMQGDNGRVNEKVWGSA